MTFAPSLQTAWAGEYLKKHTSMLNHNSLFKELILGTAALLLSLPAQLPAWKPDKAQPTDHNAVRLGNHKVTAKPDIAPCRLHCCLQRF